MFGGLLGVRVREIFPESRRNQAPQKERSFVTQTRMVAGL